jgi:hypothetical protein
MTDTADQIRARALQSIEDCLARVAMPEAYRSMLRDVLVDSHVPLCINLFRLDDPQLQRISKTVRQIATVLIIVNAFNEFIRTTYPDDEWDEQRAILKGLLDACLKEGPMASWQNAH